MLRLVATDYYSYNRPSKCGLRVYLRHNGEEEAPPGAYDEVIIRLGVSHEKAHLTTFVEFVDLSAGALDNRVLRTCEEIEKRTPVIYQGVLKAVTVVNGAECQIVGEPDFIIKETDGYVLRDSKLSRRITERDHPEILRQLGLYGWLYEHSFGEPPLRLEVHSGTGEIVEVPYDSGYAAMNELREIQALKKTTSEPYSPVGWSKCTGCGFYGRCWPRAEDRHYVALLADVDQKLATALREAGVEKVEELMDRFDELSLSKFSRPWGDSRRFVGIRKAESIMRQARSFLSGKDSLIQTPDIPDCPNYVMFDLEGLPPQLDEVDKIYLWGLQVFGNNTGEFQAAVAGFGEDGDREGWEEFLGKAKSIFNEHGDIPFVHWHSYERTKLDLYKKRFGDPEGVAARVRRNLLDLLPITKNSIVLPLPSYSLKVVEKYVGFERTLDEYGGDWAMAKYIEATETEDEEKRVEVMDSILAYNREDLEATWAVLTWLKSKKS